MGIGKGNKGARQRCGQKIRQGLKPHGQKLTRGKAGTLDEKNKTNWQRPTQSKGLKTQGKVRQ